MTSLELPVVELTVVDTNGAASGSVPLPPPEGLELLPQMADRDTGMEVFKAVYKAGFVDAGTPIHAHTGSMSWRAHW